MKIQLLNQHFDPIVSGIERHLQNFAKILVKKGIEVSVLYEGKKEKANKTFYRNKIQIMQHKTIFRLNSKLAFLNPILHISQLKKLVRKYSADVDILYTRHYYYGYAAKKVFPKKIMVYVSPGFQKIKRQQIELSPTARVSFKRKIFSQINSWIKDYIETRVYQESDIVISHSQMHKRQITETFGISDEKVFVIPAAKDLQDMSLRKGIDVLKEYSIPKDAKIVLTVSRVVYSKNIDMIIQAVDRIESRKVFILVVGDGPDITRLKNIAMNETNMGDRVIFAGHQESIIDFYSVADVFVMVSRKETFGQVYLEAMTLRVPCIGLKPDYPEIEIATDEIIENNRTGFILDENTVEDLSDKIQKIILNDSTKRQMGEQAYKVCKEKFSWDNYTDKCLKVICERFDRLQ